MYKYFIKRFIDLILASALLILFLPFMALIFFILLIELKAFPLFFQKRALTLDAKPFWVYKFKTIREDARLDERLTLQSVFYKPELQKYIPRFSRLLRITGLDELPQLINVLLGDMSLIGPRPLMLSDLELLKKEQPDLFSKRSEVTCLPGMTGLWQILGNRKHGLQNLIELDLLYNKGVSVSLDLVIFFITIPFMLLGLLSDAILYERKERKISIALWLQSVKELILSKIKSSIVFPHY